MGQKYNYWEHSSQCRFFMQKNCHILKKAALCAVLENKNQSVEMRNAYRANTALYLVSAFYQAMAQIHALRKN